MPRITFISHDGTAQVIDAESGLSLMESAIRAGVEGIDADCGGACACGTCRVVIAEAWRDRLGDAGDVEAMMLEMAPLPLEGARLSCQIAVTDALEGLSVSVPEEQFR
ncbi:2Fe-2S iron-sulfur cluster-binding protein [Sphingobium phenoxybenzoativorans]|uniref:2Fe-2S iron-sulfur cluster-binding protein n=1 Tax=Sphingobium phenoxybenzoativorans TaxID=1592790 RepID=UPI000872402D|nr:2Fe-2S iron-sulfur cluster-binding protein [Sphingobium phenoxybenzoativorans]